MLHRSNVIDIIRARNEAGMCVACCCCFGAIDDDVAVVIAAAASAVFIPASINFRVVILSVECVRLSWFL